MEIRRRVLPVALGATLTAAAVGGPASAAERQYTATGLGSLNGGTTTAAAIKESGTVVGTSGDHAFVWRAGTLTDLGALSGGTSAAVGVDESGNPLRGAGLLDRRRRQRPQ